MAAVLGAGGGGPTLWMTVAAKDRTKETFDRVSDNMNKLSATALRAVGRIGSLGTQFAILGRVTGMLNDEQARGIGVFGTTIRIMISIGTVIKALTSIEWAHVGALTWKVSLMTLGIGVAIAAAAAMAVLAMQTNKAADAQAGYNTELEKGTSIQRRTVNQKIVSRGGFEEILE